MELSGGTFRADAQSSRAFCRRCRDTGIMLVEMLIMPKEKQPGGAGVVVGLFGKERAPNLEIVQRRGEFWLKLITRSHTSPPVRDQIGSVETGTPTHLLLFYIAASPNDKLFCYLNGKLTLSKDYDGGFSDWPDQQFVFGNDPSGRRPWQGSIWGVALGHRSFSAAGAEGRYRQVVEQLRNPRRPPRPAGSGP
jgi:hypothetical protein